MQSFKVQRAVVGRSAVTLVEAIAAVAILGTLLALLFPAVQMVRAAARANTCKANLHQVGIAIANFEHVKGAIPTWWMDEQSANRKGSMAPLLPYLDQAPLWDEIASTQGRSSVVVEVLLCPDDSNALVLPGQTSFAYNGGTRFLMQDIEGNGLMTWPRWTPSGRGGIMLREIRDGLANTTAVSERMQMSPDENAALALSPEILERDVRRYLWYTTRRYSGPGEEELAARACRTQATTPVPFIWAPSSSRRFALLDIGYTHLLPPNHRACYNAADQYDWLMDYELIPPSSNHAGGVHVLMCDGQVRFVSESIGDAPWRAAGTRAGGESEGL